MDSKKWISMLMLVCSLKNVSAQETSEGNSVKNFPAQVSIFHHPLSDNKEPKVAIGTHGRKSVNYSYNLSLNLLTGKTGGLNGLGISGLFGHVKGSAHGIQIAGLANLSEKEMIGLQISGLANVAGEKMNGLQFGSLVNVAGDGMSGLQIGGLVNVAGEEVKGLQIGGFVNVAGEEMTGLQTAGFVNVATEGMHGLQMGGVANVAVEGMNGLQIGGVANAAVEKMNGIQIVGGINVAKDARGMQIAGISNRGINKKEPIKTMKGLQIAGIFNSADHASGLQIAGIYNRAGTLRGINIGMVSITDTIEKGVSLSLVNIVRKGFYTELDLSFSDYATVAFSYKMGMQRFYTIYTVGAAFIEDKLWVAGMGFGNRTPIGKRLDFQPELVVYNYFPIDFKNIKNTSDTRLKLGFVYRINEKLGLSLAPSIYLMNAKIGAGISLGLSFAGSR